MTPYDADERVKPLKSRKNPTLFSDRMLGVIGFSMAAAAAAFPWYVFFNEDKFGIATMITDGTRDLPDWPGRNVFSVSPLAMVNKNPPQDKEILPPVDTLTTATVSSLGKERPDGAALMEDQPFPGPGGFRLLHVANGRALIEDSKGMYMLRVGSTLPDNSRLARIEQRDGKWVIVSSTGAVYENR